jgi:hypothetical protein
MTKPDVFDLVREILRTPSAIWSAPRPASWVQAIINNVEVGVDHHLGPGKGRRHVLDQERPRVHLRELGRVGDEAAGEASIRWCST